MNRRICDKCLPTSLFLLALFEDLILSHLPPETLATLQHLMRMTGSSVSTELHALQHDFAHMLFDTTISMTLEAPPTSQDETQGSEQGSADTPT